MSLHVSAHLERVELLAKGAPRRAAALFIERQLGSLRRHEARCRRVLGELVVEMRRRQAFVPLGFIRLSDFARERLGCSASEVESAARVASGLGRLRSVARAFEAGEICWTKARILASVTEPESEERWLEAARRASVRELEGLVEREAAASGMVEVPASAVAEVRAIREDEGLEVDGEPRVRVRLSCPGWVSVLFNRVVDLARRASGADGPVWRAVEAMNFEALSSIPKETALEVEPEAFAWRACRGSRTDARRHGGSGRCPRRDLQGDRDEASLGGIAAWLGVPEKELRDLLPLDVAGLVDGAGEAPPAELDRRMRIVVREIQRIDWRTGRLLQLFFSKRLQTEVGYLSEEEYMTGCLGIAVRRVRALLAVDRVAKDVSELGAAYSEGRISWVRAMILLPIFRQAGPRVVREWMERANEVTVRTLRSQVAWVLERRVAGVAGASLEPPAVDAALEPVPIEVVAEEAAAEGAATVQMRNGEGAKAEFTGPGSVDGNSTPRVAAQMRNGQGEPAMVEVTGPESVVATFRGLVAAFSEPAEPLWKGLARLLAHVSREWLRKHGRPNRILSRDDYLCRVPACSSRRNLQSHHLVFRSALGSDEPENLAGTCAAHHLQGIHVRRINARGTAPHEIAWELGVGAGPNGEPFLRFRGDVYVREGEFGFHGDADTGRAQAIA